MRADFKISSVIRNGLTTKVKTRLAVGDITTEKERTINGLENVTRYRRAEKSREFQFEVVGTKTDIEIRAMLRDKLNSELEGIKTEKSYSTLTAIDEQVKEVGDSAPKALQDATSKL